MKQYTCPVCGHIGAHYDDSPPPLCDKCDYKVKMLPSHNGKIKEECVMKMKYQSKFPLVEAIQYVSWQDFDLPFVKEGASYHSESEWKGYGLIVDHGTETKPPVTKDLHPGDYVIKDANGNFDVVPCSIFEQFYEVREDRLKGIEEFCESQPFKLGIAYRELADLLMNPNTTFLELSNYAHKMGFKVEANIVEDEDSE